jgi:XPG I-region
MGVTNGLNVLYTMDRVRLPHLLMLAIDRAKRFSRHDPVIVVDFSWLCFKCGGDIDTPPTAFRKVAAHLLLLLESGFVVHVVLDPHHRHHSKKATVARNVAAHRATVDAIKAKSKILSLTKSIRDNIWDTVEERTELENRLKDLESAARKYERVSRGRLSLGFVDTMEELLFGLCDKTPNLSCSVAPYQADAKICYMCIDGQADLVLGNDSDFAFVIGPGCVQMTDMHLTSKECTLKIPDLATVNSCAAFVGIDLEGVPTMTTKSSTCSTELKLPTLAKKRPLLEGVFDIRLRCLFAVLLGCDVMPPQPRVGTNLSGLGLATLIDWVDSLGDALDYDSLLQRAFQCTTKRASGNTVVIDKTTISLFVDSMMYEPGDSVSGRFKHFSDEVPAVLGSYLQEWAGPTCIIDSSIGALLFCPCLEEGSEHKYFVMERWRPWWRQCQQ